VTDWELGAALEAGNEATGRTHSRQLGWSAACPASASIVTLPRTPVPPMMPPPSRPAQPEREPSSRQRARAHARPTQRRTSSRNTPAITARPWPSVENQRSHRPSWWYVYTFIADRPVRSLKDKIRALMHRTSQQPPRDVLIRLNQFMRGWANYFRRAVSEHTMKALDNFVCSRVIRWLVRLHHWKWTDVRRHLAGPGGRWRGPSADGIELFNLGAVPITRYLYRGGKIPSPWTMPNHAESNPAPRPRPTQPHARDPRQGATPALEPARRAGQDRPLADWGFVAAGCG
jgi:RNA-directed DNA polymerase